MIGEKFGDFTGKVTTARVLPPDNNNNPQPRFEFSHQQNGTLLGASDWTDIGTYNATWQNSGHYTGEGWGVMTANNGDIVTWRGTGVGRRTGKGNAGTWRGSCIYQTTSQKFSRLNGACLVFEYEVDETGNTKTNLTEWR